MNETSAEMLPASHQIFNCRSATERDVEKAVEHVWGYVRANAHSLDSERATKKIMELVLVAVSGVHRRLEAVTNELTDCRKTLRKVRGDNRGLSSEVESLMAESASSRDKLRLLTDFVDDQMNRSKNKALGTDGTDNPNWDFGGAPSGSIIDEFKTDENKRAVKQEVQPTKEEQAKLLATARRVREKFNRQQAKRNSGFVLPK